MSHNLRHSPWRYSCFICDCICPILFFNICIELYFTHQYMLYFESGKYSKSRILAYIEIVRPWTCKSKNRISFVHHLPQLVLCLVISIYTCIFQSNSVTQQAQAPMKHFVILLWLWLISLQGRSLILSACSIIKVFHLTDQCLWGTS